MTELVLGTAHLFGLVDDEGSRALLAGAARAGVRRLDTAPSYGHGLSEAAVGDLIADGRAAWRVTTKVGIEPVAAPSQAKRAAKAIARRLPGRVQDRLRGDRPVGGGQFDPAAVEASIRRSVGRLGQIDRLLLHEVRPADITPDLLRVLEAAVASGDVTTVGLATANDLTRPCLAIAPGLFSVVHLAVGLHSELPEVPDTVTVVGHGALGAGGADLAGLSARIEHDDVWGRRWQQAGAGTRWSGRAGLADALVVRAASRAVGYTGGTGSTIHEIIVASSRLERVLGQRQLLVEDPVLDGHLDALLDEASR